MLALTWSQTKFKKMERLSNPICNIWLLWNTIYTFKLAKKYLQYLPNLYQISTKSLWYLWHIWHLWGLYDIYSIYSIYHYFQDLLMWQHMSLLCSYWASAKDLCTWLHLVAFGHACHMFQTVTNDNKEIE